MSTILNLSKSALDLNIKFRYLSNAYRNLINTKKEHYPAGEE